MARSGHPSRALVPAFLPAPVSHFSLPAELWLFTWPPRHKEAKRRVFSLLLSHCLLLLLLFLWVGPLFFQSPGAPSLPLPSPVQSSSCLPHSSVRSYRQHLSPTLFSMVLRQPYSHAIPPAQRCSVAPCRPHLLARDLRHLPRPLVCAQPTLWRCTVHCSPNKAWTFSPLEFASGLFLCLEHSHLHATLPLSPAFKNYFKIFKIES